MVMWHAGFPYTHFIYLFHMEIFFTASGYCWNGENSSSIKSVSKYIAWNDPAIGIAWPMLVGEYKGTASAEGYCLEDGTKLNLSDKDQKWLGLQNK